jgi:SAM-dependent methyltransferase
MLEPTAVIREDFDRIARLAGETWSQNNHYHPFLLRQLPSRFREALDIGCGKGAFSRLLAGRADHITAVDLSPEMIRLAKERSTQFSNIDFQTADILTWPWPDSRYDCIASIATLHHLPLETFLERCPVALRPGGTLLVLDLYKAASVADYLAGALALPASAIFRVMDAGRLRDSRAIRDAWAEHGLHEHYPTLAEIRGICRRILPGAVIRRHLMWRYSIVWKKLRD